MDENNQYEEKLEKLRIEIEDIDDKIVDLLNQRANLVLKIGSIKKTHDLDTYQPIRERKVIQRIKNKSTIYKSANMESIWNEIIGAGKVIQDSIAKVGYLGPVGTFTHQAALEIFPKSGTEFSPLNNPLEIFENVEKDNIDFGVLAIENTLQGTVRDTLDLLIEHELVIYNEIELKIIQNLITLEGAELTDIENIFSHPQAFAQTRSWIKANLPKAVLIDVSSTAEAVRRVKKLNDKSYAAIGTKFSSEIYDLNILKAKIEDSSNFTRFIVVSKQANPLKSENMKTSVVFVTKHVPGALYWVLKIFSDADINLSKIESRPSRKGRWEYIFLMDFEGDVDDERVKEALDRMKSNVIWHKILGCYPIK
jgi:chorismate mutase/prephenate dehydratase